MGVVEKFFQSTAMFCEVAETFFDSMNQYRTYPDFPCNLDPKKRIQEEGNYIHSYTSGNFRLKPFDIFV